MINEIKNISSTQKELRDFGLLVGGVFLVLGIFILKNVTSHAAIIGFTLVTVGLIKPKLLKYIYICWMTIALMMGWVVTRIILLVVFLLVMIPLKLVLQWKGERLLDTKINKRAKTYWLRRQASTDYVSILDKQF